MKDLWTDRLSEYLDGELPAAAGHALEQHVAGCDACRATLDDLRAVGRGRWKTGHRPGTCGPASRTALERGAPRGRPWRAGGDSG
jgi:anti-sigma factor RsiW